MCPIKGLSEQKRLPRLGKIHLGIKKTNKQGVEYPSATNYFVCPTEVQAVYGEQPQRLDIFIPVEDDELWASQYYRQYSRTRGLVCKGDGVTCRRMIDIVTGSTANRDSSEILWKDRLPCTGRECPDYQAQKCKEVMNLQFILPKVPGIGIWQIDTGSINSIRNINNMAAMIRATCDRISWLPLVLTIEPTEVTNPDDGKKKMVHCLNMRYEGNLGTLLVAGGKAKNELLITTPAEDEAPMDGVIDITPSTLEQAEKDSAELFEPDPPNASSVAVKGTQEEAPEPTKDKPAPIEIGQNSEQLHEGMSFKDLLAYVKDHKKTEGWLFKTISLSVDEAKANPYQAALAIKEIAGW